MDSIWRMTCDLMQFLCLNNDIETDVAVIGGGLSWDCPCHGSRFDYKGNLLDNPAQVNILK